MALSYFLALRQNELKCGKSVTVTAEGNDTSPKFWADSVSTIPPGVENAGQKGGKQNKETEKRTKGATEKRETEWESWKGKVVSRRNLKRVLSQMELRRSSWTIAFRVFLVGVFGMLIPYVLIKSRLEYHTRAQIYQFKPWALDSSLVFCSAAVINLACIQVGILIYAHDTLKQSC